MKLKSLTGKRKTGKGRIAAVLALAVLLGAAPAIKTDAYPAGPYTVTLNAPSDEAYADLVNANVTVDVYKVASAVAQDGTDAYTLSFEEAFKSAEADYISNIQEPSEPDGEGVKSADVDAFAQKLEGIALDGSVSHGNAVIGTGDTFSATVTIADGEAGMYLLIPHGADDYIYESEDKDSTYKATTANGDSKQYIFAPILITVPNRQQSSLGTGYIDSSVFGEDFNYPIEAGNTANRDDWDFEGDEKKVEITLKIGWKDLDTKFQIDKNLVTYETAANRTDPATFVFRIDAVDKKGALAFSDVRSITLSSDGTSEPIEIDKVPVGSTVTVTEVYFGGDYKYDDVSISGTTGTPVDQGIQFEAVPVVKTEDGGEQMVLVSFKNTYNDTWKDSGSVTNKFTRAANEDDGQISWVWEADNSHPTAEAKTAE